MTIAPVASLLRAVGNGRQKRRGSVVSFNGRLLNIMVNANTMDQNESISRYGNRGVLDAALIEKDLYFYYQSQWTTAPMVHILPHWTHSDLALGTVVPVHAYTNGAAAELWLNGQSLGKQDIPSYGHGAWDVPWQPGTITVVAYDHNGEVIAEANVITATSARRVRLQADHPQLGNNDDITRVHAIVVDDHGVPVPAADSLVHMVPHGPVSVHSSENGNRLDLTSLRSPVKRVFAGQGAGGWARMTRLVPVLAARLRCTASVYLQNQQLLSVSIDTLLLRDNDVDHNWQMFITTDGSEASVSSQLYTEPLLIDRDTQGPSLVRHNGEDVVSFDEHFRKGQRACRATGAPHYGLISY